MLFINESGLYSLILSSKLESARRFKYWVTSEVLPSIRKQGGYMVLGADESDEVILARALQIMHTALERRESALCKWSLEVLSLPLCDSLPESTTANGIRTLFLCPW